MKNKLLTVLLGLCFAVASTFALTACGETSGTGDKNNEGSGSTVTTPDGNGSGSGSGTGTGIGSGTGSGTETGGGTGSGSGSDTDKDDDSDTADIDGLQFNLLSDGTYEISKYTGRATSLVLPSKYNDVIITSIGRLAFFDRTTFTSVK